MHAPCAPCMCTTLDLCSLHSKQSRKIGSAAMYNNKMLAIQFSCQHITATTVKLGKTTEMDVTMR